MGLMIFGLFLGLVFTAAYVGVNASINNDRRQSSSWDNKEPELAKSSKGIIALLILTPFLLFTLLASIARVGTGEIAVMTRFGRVTGQELGEGIHLKNPLDKANKYDVKVQKEQAEAAAASKDLQDVNSTLVINYSLEAGRVSEIHQNVGEIYKEKLIDPAIQEVFKAATAKYDATTLITDRAGVKKEAFELLRDRLDPYGITVLDLSITNFSFSPEFAKAIEDKQVAQQNAEKAKFNAQKAEQDAQAEINRAKGSAEAQRLQQQTLTPLLVQKQFIEKWDGKMPVVVGGEGNLLDISSLIKNKE